jgi:RNA polymerase sigma factor (sigma-70 family)
MSGELRPENHVGLLFWLAGRNAKKYGRSRDEMVSHGAIGLMRAAEMYDATRGTRESTYAASCIKTAMFRGEYECGNSLPLVRPCPNILHGWGRFRGRELPNISIAAISVATEPRSANVIDDVIRREGAAMVRAALKRLRNRRQQLFLLLYFWRGWKMPRIAARAGCSKERVKAVIDEGLAHIRKAIACGVVKQ